MEIWVSASFGFDIETSKRRGGPDAVTDSLNANTKKVRITEVKTENEGEKKMSENEYDVVISTPMGDMDGKVTLDIDGSKLSGTIFFMKNENRFSGGTVDEEGNISFKGDLKTPVGKMEYTIEGILKDGRIDAVAKTKMGDLKIVTK